MTRCPKCGHSDSVDEDVRRVAESLRKLCEAGYPVSELFEYPSPPQPTLWQRFKSWCARVSA
jgi:hypothetical protein